jgi:hypothetical protein
MIYDESVGMALLEIFRARNLQASTVLFHQGLEFEVSEIGNLEYKPCCSVNVKSKRLLCNLAMWSSGECDLLVTNETAADVLINETNLLENASDVQKYLDVAYERLLAITNGETQQIVGPEPPPASFSSK